MTVFYDGQCGFCKLCIALLLLWDRSRCLRPLSIQDPEAQRLLAPVPEEERLLSAHVQTPTGEILSGADAAPLLLRQLPGGRPLAMLTSVSMPLARLVYRLVSNSRPALGKILPTAWRRWAIDVITERQAQDGSRDGDRPPPRW